MKEFQILHLLVQIYYQLLFCRMLVAQMKLVSKVNISNFLHQYGSFTVESICTDTLIDNPTETIIIDSHSDSAPIGPDMIMICDRFFHNFDFI